MKSTVMIALMNLIQSLSRYLRNKIPNLRDSDFTGIESLTRRGGQFNKINSIFN